MVSDRREREGPYFRTVGSNHFCDLEYREGAAAVPARRDKSPMSSGSEVSGSSTMKMGQQVYVISLSAVEPSLGRLRFRVIQRISIFE